MKNKLVDKSNNLSLNLITVVFGIIILTIGILNHYYFRTFAFDYAAYNFAWRDYAHFRISGCTVYWSDNFSFFQDHFSLTFIILMPLYWIMTPIFGTYSLLILQSLFILLGGWGTYKLVEFKTKKNLYAVLALILYYTTYGRWASFITDVNLEIILSSLVPVFLFLFEKKKLIWAHIIFAFLLLGRESISLWMLFIAAFLFLMHLKDDKKMRNLAVIYGILSIFYFVVTFKIFIPLIHSEDRPFNLFNYSVLGDSPFSALKTLIKNPEKTFSLLFINHSGKPEFDYVKTEFYFLYLLSGMILLIWKPKYLLPFIPIIAQKVYNDDPLRWGIETYYSIEIVTMLPYSLFLALNEIKFTGEFEKKSNLTKKTIAFTFIILSVLLTIHKFDLNNRQIPWYQVEKNKFYDKRMYVVDFDAKMVHQNLKVIPDTAKVAACSNIAPHLAFRDYIYYLPRVDDADYIALLENKKHYIFSEIEYNSLINSYVFNENWNVIINDFPLLIMKKEKNTSVFTEIKCNCETFSPDSSQFKDNSGNILFNNADLVSQDYKYSGNNSIKLNNENPFGLTTELNNIQRGDNIKITAWIKGTGAVLVASDLNSEFYLSSSKTIEQHEDWAKIELDVIIKKQLPENILKIYVWKNSDDLNEIYVDDLNILKL